MDKKLVYIILGCIIILGIIFRFACINNEFTAEETDFVKPAYSLVNYGHLYYYNSEQLPNLAALFHPPMYNFLLAAIFNFNYSEASARSLNILASFLIGFLIFSFCSVNFRRKKLLLGILALAGFLINYYSVSSSILIDIDVLSALFTLLFVFFICKIENNKPIYFYLAGLAFFLALWNRYIIALIVYFFIGLYFLFNKNLRSFFFPYILTGLVSGLAFIGSWAFYSIVIEPGKFFSFITHNLNMGGEQFSSISVFLASFILNIIQLIRLITFPTLVIFSLAIIHFRKNSSYPIRILMIYTLSILLFFLAVPRPAFGYPRYFFSALPGIFILISLYVCEKTEQIRGKRNWILIILAFVGSILLLILFNPQATIYTSNGLIKATNLPDFIFNIFAFSPIILVFLAPKKVRLSIFIVMLLVISLGYSLYFDSKLILHDENIKETADYIKQHTSINDVIIAPKAIGQYSERRFYNNDNNKPNINLLSIDYASEYFIKSYYNRDMNDPFFWPSGIYSGLYGDVSIEKLNEAKYLVKYYPIKEANLEKKIGEFYIYRIN
jgi:hypothetical protein